MADIYDYGDWFKCSKEIVRDKNISQSAKWLYVVLSCHNNMFGKNKGFFTRTNEDLKADVGMSDKTLKKAKKELIDNGYIEVWHNNLWQNADHDKQTTFKICYYRILK